MKNNNVKVALIGPRFFSYLEAVRQQLEKEGIPAIAVDDIHSRSLFWRVVYRLRFEKLYGANLQRYNRSLAEKFEREGVSHVLFVNCETYDEQFLDMCESLGIRVSIYFWDAIGNKPVFKKYIERYDVVSSFDIADCQKYKLKYIPLFAESDFFDSADLPKKYDVSMVSTVHSQRWSWIKKLNKLSRSDKFRIEVFSFFSSKLLYVIKNIFHLRALSLLPSISTTPMNKQEVAEMFGSSRYVVDVHHFKQNGLTSRTFETLASGAALVTTNENVQSLPNEFHSRVFVVNSPNDLNGILKSQVELKPLQEKSKYYLSIERFVKDLKDLMKIDLT